MVEPDPPQWSPPTAPLTSMGANTNVIEHAGRTLALIEGGVANYELTDELDTVGPHDFDGTLPSGYTAHPKRDPRPASCTRCPTSTAAAPMPKALRTPARLVMSALIGRVRIQR